MQHDVFEGGAEIEQEMVLEGDAEIGEGPGHKAAIDGDLARRAGEQPGDAPSCPYRLLSVGKWERRKGFDVLLRAYLSEFANLSSSSSSPATAAAAVGGLPQGVAPPPPAPRPHVELFILTSAYHSTRDFDAAVAAMVT
jgi:hypothetical protein